MSALDRLLDPASIAIVGLSANEAKHGGRVLRHLRRLGYAGALWGVNPRRPAVEGVEIFASLFDLPEPPDVVVCAVPGSATLDVVADAAGVGAVVVFAGGFGESGSDGVAREEALVTAALEAGTRVLGPNSGGVIRPDRALAASFLTCLDRSREEIRGGPVGVVTQSGGLGSLLHNVAAERGGGLAVSVSTGNEADIKLGEMIDAVSRLDEVKVVLVLLETVRDGETFAASVRSSMDRGKPVVACRIGTGDRGADLMRTHTGAMALSEVVLSGVLESLGVVVADTPGEALEVAEVMARVGRPAGGRVAIVTHSGGMAIHLSDLAERRGLELPPPGTELVAALAPMLDHGAANNPLDLGGIISGASRFADVVGTMAHSGDYDIVLAASTAHPPQHSQERVGSLLALNVDSPVVHLWMAGDQARGALASLRSAGAPVVEEPRAAVQALAGISSRASRRRFDSPEPIMGEPSSWGIPVVEGELVFSLDEAVGAAERIGGRVALKAQSSELAHKSDLGLVKVDLEDEEEVRAAYVEITTAASGMETGGIRVERFRPGLEMIVGGIVDRRLGPLVSVGLGGVFVELLDDVVFALAPVSVGEATAMIERLRGRALLDGYRGSRPSDVDSLAQIVSVVSRGLVGSGISEVELNPLIWDGEEWVAVDLLWSG